jgi:hypothetical protein
MSIAIFWIQSSSSDMFPAMSEPKCRQFGDDQLSEAMTFMREKRTEVGVSHVGMVNEPEGMVGTKDAGGSVQDGKLPDGSAYTWMKRRSQ